MAKTNPDTIILKGDKNVIRKEASAGGAINPGHLITLNSSGNAVVQPTTQVFARKTFALENDLNGETITDAYASGDQVIYAVAGSGVEVYAKLAAGATAVANADPLTPAADGTLKKGTVGTHDIIGFAIEAVDNSGGGTEAFIKMEVI